MKIQRQKNNAKKASKAMILRSVASSTAIETGQPIKKIEHKLKTGNSRFQNLSLKTSE